MFTGIISKSRHELLDRLKNSGLLKGFYMAGGTAAALHMGHRMSEDFDFFSPKDFEPDNLALVLGKQESFTVSSSQSGTLHGLITDIRLSFLFYDYPLLYPTVDFGGVQIADLRDIALMKITAIAGRGSSKDFIDLFFICQEVINLKELLVDLFPRKYGMRLFSTYHILRSLQYFEDAEKNPPLEMLKHVNWEEVKQFFVEETQRLIKEKLIKE